MGRSSARCSCGQWARPASPSSVWDRAAPFEWSESATSLTCEECGAWASLETPILASGARICQPRPCCFAGTGETNWNLERKFQGVVDIPLNELGINQAHLIT